MTITAVCLMGATATGKTDIAVRLSKRFAFDVISVDSALVYRGMDIGTAKPDRKTLERVPHRLIDIRDPEEPYSAGEFVRDARTEIQSISLAGRVPLLVGGTMMYFRALTEGIADLPAADSGVREQIDRDAALLGWPALHAQLAEVDPESAVRINPNDSQRIQRALEVYRMSGQPLSRLHREARDDFGGDGMRFIKLALDVPSRAILHERIEQRLDRMLGNGFLDEVRSLMQRPGLAPDMPAMRAVGYRQIWAHLAGELSLEEGRYRALVATRQLAKRQITWLRGETALGVFDPLEAGCVDRISRFLVNSGLFS
jgi:tRNA dimethylallyltransferase